jgi:hypothetical protein
MSQHIKMQNMKRLLTLVSVLLLTVAGLTAQNAQTAPADSIVFEKMVHDYGTITQGADGGCEFVFVNKGEKPLILSNVRASCGCTAPTWPKEPILPGQKGVIKVGYNTMIIGGFSKSVTVTSNAVNSNVNLIVKGNVIPKGQASN